MTISAHENAAALFAAAFIQSGHAGDEVRAAERYYAALEALENEHENRRRRGETRKLFEEKADIMLGKNE